MYSRHTSSLSPTLVTQFRPSVFAFHRLRLLPARLLPWVVAALLFTGIAHAAHLHKPDALGHTDALHCGLCLQFDRLADAPHTPQLIVAPALVSWAPLPQGSPLPSALLVLLYDARGPPRLTALQ